MPAKKFKPSVRGEVPTLGYIVIDWMIDNLARPDCVDYEPFIPYREQVEFILEWYRIDPVTGQRIYVRGLLSRPRGWGKALALDTPVPTPDGWTTMGELLPGDIILDEAGEPTRVLAKSPVWTDTDCYEVNFSDGERVTCSGDHLWTVEDRHRKSATSKTHGERTLDTREMVDTHRTGARKEVRYRLPMPSALQLKPQDLPIDPYVLGVWLADGDSDCGRITTPDQGVVDEIAAAGFEVSKGQRYRWTVRGLATHLREQGLLHNKHVPAQYLRGSVDQRMALLQGLMDSDGYVDPDNGQCEYTTCDARIRDGVAELLATLGIKHSVSEGRAVLNGKDCGPKWRIFFHVKNDTPTFRLPRKQGRLHERTGQRELFTSRKVVSVKPIDTVPTVCIQVDSPSHLFLVGRKMVQTHNSPLLGALAIVECLGPCLFSHWDDNGRPVAKRWIDVRTPLVQIAAVSDKQTANTFLPIMDMLREDAPIHDEIPGINVMNTFVEVTTRPGWRIEKVASSSRTLKGAKAVAGIQDQTEEWVQANGGHDLADVMRANAAKVNGTVLESPNAYMPGDDSVAERSAAYAQSIKEGVAQDATLLWDHRESPPLLDLDDRKALLEGLRLAYGDASADPRGCVIHNPPCPPGHVNLERLISTIYDPAQDIQRSRSDFLNQITHHSDSWLTSPQWNACYRAERSLPDDGAAVTLGFDGSMGRARGKADATALVGVEVATGHMFQIGVWEQPNGPAGKGWTPPVLDVDTAVRNAFARWNVVGFYADPNGWTEYIAKWEASYGRRLWLKASGDHPIMVWPAGKTAVVTKFVERTRVAVVTSGEAWTRYDKAVADGVTGIALPEIGEFSHDGSMEMSRHFLNARRRKVASGYLIYKAYPESRDKIDAAYAGVMAWTARLDAIAKGFAQQRTAVVEAVIV